MKNLKKLLLMGLAATANQAHAMENVYGAIHTLWSVGRHISALSAPAISTLQLIQIKQSIDQLPDAPEIVVQFCKEQCKMRGLEPDDIVVKVRKECAVAEAFETNNIFFNPTHAQALKNALENRADEGSNNVVKIYATLIDHEISHLKNNDSSKRYAAQVATALLCYVASTYVVNAPQTADWFKKPTTFKEFLMTGLAFNLLAYASTHITNTVVTQYALYQEKNADAYAIAQATDPQALRFTGNYLEQTDSAYVELLCGADIHAILPGLPLVKCFATEMIRTAALMQHVQEAPQEDLRSWAQKQTEILAQLKAICDPEHPSGFERGALMRQAADELEKVKEA